MKNRPSTLLLTRPGGQVRSYEYDPQRILIITVFTVIALCTLILLGGYHLGTRHEARNQINEVRDLQVVAEMQQQVIEQCVLPGWIEQLHAREGQQRGRAHPRTELDELA